MNIGKMRSKLRNRYYNYLLSGMDPRLPSIFRRNLTYLEPKALFDLTKAVRETRKGSPGGIYIEAGCALGGSALAIAMAKDLQTPFYIYDVFDMIPPPSERDGEDSVERYQIISSNQSKGIGGDTYYGYVENLLEKVKKTFGDFQIDLEKNHISFIRGLYQDTLDINEPVAFAHIDCDWYDSVRTCLEKIEPNLVPGGRLVLDDYFAWSGCKKAVDEYFTDKMDKYQFMTKSRLNIIKK